MRLYTFVNMYLSSIQAGIQSAHLLGELSNQTYSKALTTGADGELLYQALTLNERDTMFCEWCKHHKTMIVCNGGTGANLRKYIELFEKFTSVFPWAIFHEDDDSLDCALTCVGIVLPEYIYDVETVFVYNKKTCEREKTFVYKGSLVDVVYDRPESLEYQLIDKIKSSPLAR